MPQLSFNHLRSLTQPLLLYFYLIRQFSHHLILSLAAFTIIFLLVDFFEKIDRLFQADLDPASMAAYFLLKVPLAASQVLPAAVLLAVILTFGLLSRRQETMAIKCAGIDILQLLFPLSLLALLLSFCLGLLQLYLNPWFQQQVNILWETKVEKKPAQELMDLKSLWYKGDRAIFHILEFRKDTKTMLHVKIYAFDQNFHLIQFIAAREAQWTGQLWQLRDGLVQTFLSEGRTLSESFRERNLILTERPEDFVNLERRLNEMDSDDLYRYIKRLERDGYDSTPYWLEFYNRFSLALTPLVVTFLGGGIILWRENNNIPLCIALGIILVFSYWFLHSVCNSLGGVGWLPPFIASWAATLIYTAAAIAMLRQASR